MNLLSIKMEKVGGEMDMCELTVLRDRSVQKCSIEIGYLGKLFQNKVRQEKGANRVTSFFACPLLKVLKDNLIDSDAIRDVVYFEIQRCNQRFSDGIRHNYVL